ncbi:vacuolar protein sorting-associated protein 73 [Teratosphaeria destructans]|uniref:Vacuolar protein sorting-associated protein 73 n=1 Tax=Teratosphaeria destructans TaxID=418781 RepID=A0A9W7SP97_9PEZI|nr:vacuolar protein sorting-associated protein 73 [Teratosphaeria destructans]
MATSKSMVRDLTPYLLYLLLTATIGPLLFGYHLSELNAPQEVITCARQDSASYTSRLRASLKQHAGYGAETTAGPALPQCIPMDATQFGLVSSFFTLGGLIGALSGGPVTTKYGRLKAMITAAAFAAVGPVFEALATNVALFTVGRFIAGVGAGAATVIVPIYISEIAPPGQKGAWGSLTQVMINVGILTTQLLGLFLSRGQLWRIILGVGGAIAVLQAVLLLLGGQESPKWMADHGKPSQAKKILLSIRGHQANVEEEVTGWGVESSRDLDDEEQTLLQNEDRMHEHPGEGAEYEGAPEVGSSNRKHNATRKAEQTSKAMGFLAVLKNSDYRPAVIAVVAVMVAQQLCGINSIVMYGVGLLSDLLGANSGILNLAVSALNLIVTSASAPLVDRAGRKTCLLMSITGMGIMSVLLAIGIMRHIPILSAISVLGFVASFGLGLGPVPFILSSELVGAEAVGATQSWALAANWIATFVVAQFFPLINEKMPKGTVYFVFAGFALVFGGFVAWWVPETKGKSDVDEVWGRKKGDRED